MLWIRLPHASDLLLARLVFTTRHQSVEDDEHGCRVVAEWFPLVWLNQIIAGVEPWFCFAGLQPVVVHCLQDAGYEVDVEDAGVACLPSPCASQRNVHRPVDQAWLRCVQQNDRAICRYDPSNVQPEWLITQVAHAWPDKTIMVWTKSLSEAKELTRRLQRLGVTAFWNNGHFVPNGRPQVLLATLDYFSRDTDVQMRDIAFVLDAATISPKAGHHRVVRV
jgi:hypothetical protein